MWKLNLQSRLYKNRIQRTYHIWFCFEYRGNISVTISPRASLLGYVCLSAGDGYVLSAHYCCGVCSCGYAPSLCPCRRIEIFPSPSCLLDDHFLARVFVSLKRGQRSCDLCLSLVPSLCPGPCLLWPVYGNVTANASVSSYVRILHLHYCCGVHWTLSHCCHGGWSWTWGVVGGVRVDVAEVMDCDCENESVIENYRSLSDCAYCCNWK